MQQEKAFLGKLSFQVSEESLLFNTELCSPGNSAPQDCQTHSLASKVQLLWKESFTLILKEAAVVSALSMLCSKNEKTMS